MGGVCFQILSFKLQEWLESVLEEVEINISIEECVVDKVLGEKMVLISPSSKLIWDFCDML